MKNALAISPSKQIDAVSTARIMARKSSDYVAIVREVLAIGARAQQAARYYEELKPLTAQALAHRGVKRSDLPKAVFHKLVGRS
jgi:hypothetical protein